MHVYDADFYRYQGAGSLRSARLVVAALRQRLPLAVRSVVDLGCGAGGWLAAWKEQGCEVCGVDGDYVAREALLIGADEFRAHDLTRELALGRRFDLAQCLEVAEHLPPAAAPVLVASLCRHADLVLFSAAPPGQGGEHHVNERPYGYWRELFAAQGFAMHDPLRPGLLADARILPWYRYNTFLYVGERASAALREALADCRVAAGREPPDLAPWPYRLRRRVVALLPVAAATALAVAKKRAFNTLGRR